VRCYAKGQCATVIVNPPYEKIELSAVSTVGGGDRLRLRSRRASFTEQSATASELLEQLDKYHVPQADRRSAIVYAESKAYSGSDLERLLSFYESWIESHRFSEDDDTITVLCSAIRKFSMNMNADRYATYVNWFTLSDSERVHHDVELELTKGTYWHLRYLPTTPDQALRSLQQPLIDLASDYLKPRLMLDKNYASIAKFAVTACVLIDARFGTDEASLQLWSMKSKLSMSWFDRLVELEVGKALKTIGKRDADFDRSVNELLANLKREGE